VIASESEAREFVARRCDPRAMDRLERLAAMLTEANTRQNLVSAGSLASVWQRHIADSAQLLDQGPNPWGGPVMDLGSGAGFPGLVLAAMRPETEVRLVESRRLRVEWLANCVAALDLRRCVVEGVRVEALRDAKAAVLCARAFAPLPRLIALARRFSTADTVWLLPKGRSAAQEVADLPVALRRMFHVEQSLTDPEAGIVVGRISEATRR
jgi:16S rRNA (guanine527-N7)-methyltransferase